MPTDHWQLKLVNSTVKSRRGLDPPVRQAIASLKNAAAQA